MIRSDHTRGLQDTSNASDTSSIVTVSEKATDSDDMSYDTAKFRLPDVGKTLGKLSNDDSPFSGPPSASMTPRDPNHPAASQDLPPPPPKYSPDIPDPSPPATAGAGSIDLASGEESYFNPYGLQRAGSVYSLSRVSFTNQISQLTSIPLPEASSLASSIQAIPTSTAAGKKLDDAANQIRQWMSKASDVLDGLDAEDDVEWAAAGGREGLGEVDAALHRFERLIGVYVMAIEQLQKRKDASDLPAEEQSRLVAQMEHLLRDWQNIKGSLRGVKGQVEIALEWEELWSHVLGDIGLELDALSSLIFEMEERRYRIASGQGLDNGSTAIDLQELKSVVQEAPRSPQKQRHGQSHSNQETVGAPPVEDSNLLALFARMQPLRASLDFIPMRLSVYFTRAKHAFPTACDELEQRRDSLESTWQKLQDDAESLRKEFSEDQWVDIFRKAAMKAQKMWESVTRSLIKLREGLDSHEDASAMKKKIASYKDKKTYYFPAIESVMTIIDTGIRDRLTVNGEIVRLQSDLRTKLTHLQQETQEMDELLLHGLGVDITKDIKVGRSLETSLSRSNSDAAQQLRDSMSTVTTDHSLLGSAIDTPGSSPASSVIMSRKSSEQGRPGSSTPHGKRSASSSFSSTIRSKLGSLQPGRRQSSLPASQTSHLPRRSLGPGADRSHSSNLLSTPARSTSRMSESTPIPSRASSRPPITGHGHSPPMSESLANRPRWNGSVNLRDTTLGHNHPSPSRVPQLTPRALRSVPSQSSISTPSPLGPNSTATRGRLHSSSALESAKSPTSSTYTPASRRPPPARSSVYSQQQRTPSAAATASTTSSRLRSQASTGNMYSNVRSSGYGAINPIAGAGKSTPTASRRASGIPEPEKSPSTTAARRAMASAGRPASAMSGAIGGASGRRSALTNRPSLLPSRTSMGQSSTLTAEKPRWRG